MRHTILLLILSVPYFSSCQKKPSQNSVIVDTKDKFEIKDENKVLKLIEPGTDTVRSSLIVNNDELRRIWFTTAKLDGDTLRIEIHRTDQAYDHHYVMKIFNGKCMVDYQYQMDGPDLERKVTMTEFLVKLNSLDFKKGKEIRGYTEFKGKCNGEGCYDEGNVEIKGNFKVLIR